MCKCWCKPGSCTIPIILGIIAGIASIFVGTSAGITAFLWITFGVSLLILVLFTAITLLTNLFENNEKREGCSCKNGVCLLLGAFGALATSIFALATEITTTVVIFLVVSFFTWMLISALKTLICLVKENCNG